MTRTRPPDLTERDVASSNTTLNTFFGSRQKSWMTGVPGTVRPSPRPVPTQRVQSNAGVIPSPAPSDESSPVQKQKSLVNESRTATQQAEKPLRSELPLQHPPSEYHSTDTVEELQGFPQIYSQSLPLEPQHVQYFQPSPQVEQSSAGPARFSPNVLTFSGAHQTVSSQQSPTGPRGRPPKRPRLNLDPKASQGNSPASTTSNVPSLKPRIPVIDEYIRSTGGFGNLNSSLERPRFTLLRDACNNEDVFYVVLHQMFCLWSVDKYKLHQIKGLAELGFGSANSITSAFQIMGQLIRENDIIAPHHLKWFSEFPSTMETLLPTSSLYRQSVSYVCNFLTNLTINWANLKHICAARQYPPLVDEMVDQLGLLSPVLHGVFFTATRRNLGISDDEIGAQMEKLFLQDREGHRELAARYKTAYPPTVEEARDRNAKLIKQYVYFNKFRSRREPQQSHTTSSRGVGPPHSEFRNRPAPLQNGTYHANSPVQGQDVPSYSQNGSLTGGAPMPSPNMAFRHHYYHVSQLSPTLSTPRQSPLQQPTPHFESSVPRNSNASLQHDPSFPMAEAEAVMLGQQQQQNQAAMNRFASDMAAQHYFNSVISQQQNNPHEPGQQQSSRSANSTSQQRRQDLQRQAAQQQQDQHTASATSQMIFQGQSTPQASHLLQPATNVLWPNTHGSLASSQFHNSSIGRTISNGSMASNHVPARGMSTHSPSVSSAPTVRAVPPYRFPPFKISDHALLVPQHGITIAPHAPNPDMTALHQSHLRSPILTTKGPPSASRYYQAVKSCALGPLVLPRDLMLSTHQFKVPVPIHSKIAKDSRGGPEAPICREFQQGSIQFRLRCVQLSRGTSEINLMDWVVADTYWPHSIFMEVNGDHIEVRRKNLHAKDLPVDITAHVNAAGADKMNSIRISLSRPGRSHREYYGLAVEIVEILQHQQILDMCLKEQRIPAEHTLNNIKTSLSGLANDDEVSMVVSDLTIDLADPFMAKIFEIPVRGSSCLHRECFDLETFLETRMSKPKRPTQPSMVDVWKCPLCGKDARPYSLRVDDFLLSVRNELAERQLLDTKAIIISADGTWVPKVEPPRLKRSSSKASFGYDSEDDESEIEQHIKSTTMTTSAVTKDNDIEIIVLDED